MQIQMVYSTITMIKKLSILLIITLFIAGCGKSDLESTYPTVYKKITTATLAQLREAFAQKNIFLASSLNEFGFCGYAGDLRTPSANPYPQKLTRAEAIALVKKFVSENPTATGVRNADELKFTQVDSYTGYNGALFWSLLSSDQKIGLVDVVYSKIRFVIKNNTVQLCVGNWFPDIYIPERFTIDQKEARSLLVNRVVSHYTWAGVRHVKITTEDLNKSVVILKILPVKTDDKIELRVVWQVNIPNPVYYLINVDVETGEIVAERPTVIF